MTKVVLTEQNNKEKTNQIQTGFFTTKQHFGSNKLQKWKVLSLTDLLQLWLTNHGNSKLMLNKKISNCGMLTV